MNLNGDWDHSDVSSKPSSLSHLDDYDTHPQLLCLVLIQWNHEVFQVTNRRCFQQILPNKGSSCTGCNISHNSKLSTTLFSAQFGCNVNDHSFGLVWSAQWGSAKLTVWMRAHSDIMPTRMHVCTHTHIPNSNPWLKDTSIQSLKV